MDLGRVCPRRGGGDDGGEMFRSNHWIIVGMLAAVSACSPSTTISERGAYVLYRSGATVPGISIEDARALNAMRIHVATFNAADGDAYNRENCQIAAELFAGQPMVTSRYWCEKGFYRP